MKFSDSTFLFPIGAIFFLLGLIENLNTDYFTLVLPSPIGKILCAILGITSFAIGTWLELRKLNAPHTPIHDPTPNKYFEISQIRQLSREKIKERAQAVSQPVNWESALIVATEVRWKILEKEWRPDIILGLGRSGGLWGGWLAGNLGSLPLGVIDLWYEREEGSNSLNVEFPASLNVLPSLREEHQKRLNKGVLNLLIIEGATSHGTTLKQFIELFKDELINWDWRLAALFKNPAGNPPRIHYVGNEMLNPWPRSLPWHQFPDYRPHMNSQ